MIYKTVTEFKESTEYAESMEKIKGYSKGYTFSLKYEKIPINLYGGKLNGNNQIWTHKRTARRYLQ